MRPERSVVVTLTGERRTSQYSSPSDFQESTFFSVSWTLGVVCGPVDVVLEEMCLGWLGKEDYLVYSSCECELWQKGKRERYKSSVNRWALRVYRGCCNRRWVAVVATSTYNNEYGLFAASVEDEKPDERGFYKVLDCPAPMDILSLSFFGFTEYAFESDVLEAIFLEQRSGVKYLRVTHIRLFPKIITGNETKFYCTSDLVCECPLPENDITALSKPLVNRADGTYYLFMANGSMLVLNSNELIKSDVPKNMVVEIVDDTHLCTIRSEYSAQTVSVYSLPEWHFFGKSTSTWSFNFEGENHVVPLRIHSFPHGTTLSVGCGLIISSAPLYVRDPQPMRPRLISGNICSASEAVVFRHSPGGMMHQFVDATAGTVLFSMEHTDWAPSQIEILSVPFLFQTLPLKASLDEPPQCDTTPNSTAPEPQSKRPMWPSY
ncbi:hypothetical protein Pelo_16079 [Pelomyxa schiedti]|nr:hypothetical protein Pelo_16079 [Pelomyxa schiedti]